MIASLTNGLSSLPLWAKLLIYSATECDLSIVPDIVSDKLRGKPFSRHQHHFLEETLSSPYIHPLNAGRKQDALVRDIFLVYNSCTLSVGSVHLRSVQASLLIQLVHQHPRRVKLITLEALLKAPPRCSILIFHKFSLRKLDKGVLQKLKSRNNRLVSDIIDGLIPLKLDENFDLHLASSFQQYNYLKSQSPKVSFVPHHVDIRLAKIAPIRSQAIAPVRSGLEISYVGLPINCLHSRLLRGNINFIHTGKTARSWDPCPQWMKIAARSSFMYIARSHCSWDGYKPWTKGYVGAALNIPVLTLKTGEAMHYLGPEYPYYIPSSDWKDVQDFLFDIIQSNDSRRYSRAQSLLEHARHESCPWQVSMAYLRALRNVEESLY